MQTDDNTFEIFLIGPEEIAEKIFSKHLVILIL